MILKNSRVRRLIDFGVPNWAASAVCVLMIVLYLRRAECAGPDPDAAWLAVAWGTMFGVWLYSAVFKTWQRCRSRDESRKPSDD